MVAKPLYPLYKNIIKPLDRVHYPELRYPNTTLAGTPRLWYMFLISYTDIVQSATPAGSVSESSRLDKSTDTTPLAYVVESLTRCCRTLNLVQPSA